MHRMGRMTVEHHATTILPGDGLSLLLFLGFLLKAGIW